MPMNRLYNQKKRPSALRAGAFLIYTDSKTAI